ncbi:hypothetical protein PG984_010864 [Apiospora sp. TS-2023a]
MAPKKNTDNGGAAAPAVSEGHMKLIDSMFKASPPSAKQNFNWAATAKLTGHKDAKCCRETFRQACEKYGWLKADEGETANNGATPGSAAPKKTAPKKPAKATKKKLTAKDVGDDESADEPETPSKKRKGGAANGLETPMKKTKLDDEVEGEVKDEVTEETTEAMDVAKDEVVDEI